MLPLACRPAQTYPLCSKQGDEHALAVEVGTAVRRLRHAAGLSQEALAERCDLHRTYIGAIERGEKTITISTARKLAHAFDLTLAEFFTHVEAAQFSTGTSDAHGQWLIVWAAEAAHSLNGKV